MFIVSEELCESYLGVISEKRRCVGGWGGGGGGGGGWGAGKQVRAVW